MTIEEKVGKFLAVQQDLVGEAHGQFKEDECPLKVNHYTLSWQLFGAGCWSWECGFCGKHDEE